MAIITRTVLCDLTHPTYLTIDGTKIVPECITRFSPGTRVEVRKLHSGFAVQPAGDCTLRVFGEEHWTSSS